VGRETSPPKTKTNKAIKMARSDQIRSSTLGNTLMYNFHLKMAKREREKKRRLAWKRAGVNGKTHRILVGQKVFADAEKVLAVLSQALDESFLERKRKDKETISISEENQEAQVYGATRKEKRVIKFLNGRVAVVWKTAPSTNQHNRGGGAGS
jgi:hypothetical protein